MAVEQLKNNAASTLVGAITSGATSLVVANAGTFPTVPQFRLRIDDELMLVTAVAGTTFTVTRAIEGSLAAAHSDGAVVDHIVTAAALLALRRGGITRVIAASDSEAASLAGADYACDGISDEAEFNSAVSDVAGSGGTVVLCPGTYQFGTSPAVITANKAIRIDAYGAVIKLAASVTAFTVNQGNVSARGVHIAGAHIDGQSNATTIGILLSDTNNASLEDIIVENAAKAVVLRSNAAGGFVEGSHLSNVTLRGCTTGLAFEVVSGTGSFGQTVVDALKVVVGTAGTGVSIGTGSILYRSYLQATAWIDSSEIAYFIDGNVTDSTLRLAVEGSAGSTGNTLLSIGTNATNLDTAQIHLLETGTINTAINNPSGAAFHYYSHAHDESIVQTAGTVFISYKRHGDATDRVRIEGLTAGGRIQFGTGTLLDVNLYRAGADQLKTDDSFRPASLITQVKAGTPADADIIGGAADGAMVADSTGSKLWVRIGGAWKSVTLA